MALLGAAVCQPALSGTLMDIDTARVNGLAYLYKSQRGDGSWSAHDSLKVQTTAAAVEALINAGIKSGETYGAAVAWLSNAETPSVDSAARKIAALSAAGMNMKSQAQALLAARPLLDRQIWGAYPKYALSFPDTPLGIAAVSQSGYNYANQVTELQEAVKCEILPAQRAEPSGSGWSYAHRTTNEAIKISGNGSALLPTAVTLREVARLRNIYGWSTLACGGSVYTLTTVLNNGVSYLLSQQNADRGFGENNVSTPLQTALAYLAIQAVNAGHTSLPLIQDYLLTGSGKPAADGSWNGDPLSTAIVLKTLPALSPNTLVDADRDGIPDEIELALNNGSSPAIADGRSLLAVGNGQTTPGVNSAVLAASIRYKHPMNPFQLSPSGMTAYILTLGSLPPGITMSSSGILSGVPTQIGTYSFAYKVENGLETMAQVVVAPPDGDLNNDGYIDVADVALVERIVLRHAAATTLQQVSGDVAPAGAPNGAIDLADLQRLKRLALGLE